MYFSRVDEVTASRNESVEKLKGGLLVHGTQHALPGLAQAHGTELQRRDANTSGLGEDSVPAQRGGRLGSGLKQRHVGVCMEKGFVSMVWRLSVLLQAVELGEGGMQWISSRKGDTARRKSVLNTRSSVG